MAEDKRANPYPFPTATDAENAPGDRATKAARNIASRRFTGIPKRAYILGDADGAPIVQGVRDFADAVYALVDLIDGAPSNGEPSAEVWGRIIDQNAEIVALMEDHRCPTSAES